MDRLRIALVAGSLGQGGSERQLFYVARALREQGCDVRVYSLTRGEFYEKPLRDFGIQLCWIRRSNLPLLRLLILFERLRAFRPHVIQTMHSFTNLYAVLAARCLGALSIGALRCELEFCRQQNGQWTKWLLRMPDALVVNSRKLAAELRKNGELSDSLHCLPNCVDLLAFSNPERAQRSTFTVLFAGRLIPSKRVDIFLHALALAGKQRPGIRGVIAGDGPESGRARELAAKLGLLPNGVTFLGNCQDMPAVLAQADTFVFCSDSEGSPNVILEAMASGLPVISTPAGDADTIVRDRISGFQVGFGDAEGIARGIIELAENPELRRSLGKAGRREVNLHYSASLLPGRLLDLYMRVAQQRKNRRAVEALRSFTACIPEAGAA